MPDTYDLAVAYRIYPSVSKNPLLFPDDKLRLAGVCLRSFKRALGSLRAKVWALLDNCPPEYEELFQRHFVPRDLELVRLGGVGNFQTFLTQLCLLAEQGEAEAVYFAEDDYYYLPEALATMVCFQRGNSDADFVTPYDHPDYYTMKLHQRPHEVRAHNNRHWMTAASTCMTFLTTRENLCKTRHIFETYGRRNNDASIWMPLTKQGTGLLNPVQIRRYGRSDWWMFRLCLKSWFFGWREILFGRRWKLWVPLPSLGTHMEARYPAPGIDWKELVGRDGAEIGVHARAASSP